MLITVNDISIRHSNKLDFLFPQILIKRNVEGQKIILLPYFLKTGFFKKLHLKRIPTSLKVKPAAVAEAMLLRVP